MLSPAERLPIRTPTSPIGTMLYDKGPIAKIALGSLDDKLRFTAKTVITEKSKLESVICGLKNSNWGEHHVRVFSSDIALCAYDRRGSPLWCLWGHDGVFEVFLQPIKKIFCRVELGPPYSGPLKDQNGCIIARRIRDNHAKPYGSNCFRMVYVTMTLQIAS